MGVELKEWISHYAVLANSGLLQLDCHPFYHTTY